MSRIKQLLQLKKLGLSNRQIAKELKISRDKTNEYVRMAELDSLDGDFGAKAPRKPMIISE